MPLALSTEETFEIVLNSDKDLDPQPAFIYRYISAKDQRAIGNAYDALHERDDLTTDIVFDEIIEMATSGLIGWRHMYDPETKKEIPFDVKMFDQILSSLEIQEIIVKLLAQHPDLDDKKKLDLQSPLVTPTEPVLTVQEKTSVKQSPQEQNPGESIA